MLLNEETIPTSIEVFFLTMRFGMAPKRLMALDANRSLLIIELPFQNNKKTI